MSSINCEINLILTWSSTCVITNSTGEGKFAITYIPVVICKMLEQLKSGFKRTRKWNKHQSKTSVERQNPYLDYLIDPSFQGVNRLLVLSFEDKDVRESIFFYRKYFLPTIEIKD